jgi:hypothetical protein
LPSTLFRSDAPDRIDDLLVEYGLVLGGLPPSPLTLPFRPFEKENAEDLVGEGACSDSGSSALDGE